jgi:hypothetical protein
LPGANANDAVERINRKEFIPWFKDGNWFMNRKEICLIFIAMIHSFCQVVNAFPCFLLPILIPSPSATALAIVFRNSANPLNGTL